MRIVVPYDESAPKTRLSDALSDAERVEFARAMCRDVLSAVRDAAASATVEVLATTSVSLDAPTRVDDRSLTDAVNGVLAASPPTPDDPVAVVMADLALATPAALSRLCRRDEDVVVAPGRGGGTNALVVRHPDFRVDYHGVSYRDHRERARSVGAGVDTVDSFRLATDVDEPADLAEVLLHTDARAATWLREAGFSLAVTDGRVTVTRAES